MHLLAENKFQKFLKNHVANNKEKRTVSYIIGSNIWATFNNVISLSGSNSISCLRISKSY